MAANGYGAMTALPHLRACQNARDVLLRPWLFTPDVIDTSRAVLHRMGSASDARLYLDRTAPTSPQVYPQANMALKTHGRPK